MFGEKWQFFCVVCITINRCTCPVWVTVRISSSFDGFEYCRTDVNAGSERAEAKLVLVAQKFERIRRQAIFIGFFLDSPTKTHYFSTAIFFFIQFFSCWRFVCCQMRFQRAWHKSSTEIVLDFECFEMRKSFLKI